jgi:hypothetical protein
MLPSSASDRATDPAISTAASTDSVEVDQVPPAAAGDLGSCARWP